MKRITNYLKVLSLVAIGLCLNSTVASGETLYPASYNITATYQLSDSLMALNDTLTISRMISNGESFSLTSLYLSENLPPAATIINYSATVAGQAVSPSFSGGVASAILADYDACWWQIDEPGNAGEVNDTIGPGETLSLTVRLVFDSVGEYSFPHHTTVFRGDTISFFATGDTLKVRTYILSDVNDSEDGNSIRPVRFELSQAYPNPFNSTVSIRYAGENLTGKLVQLKIRNLLGQVIHELSVRATADEGSVRWETPGSLSSGVYFYQLNCQSATITGKLVLVK